MSPRGRSIFSPRPVDLSLPTPPPWMADAACQDCDTALFFDYSNSTRKEIRAKLVCLPCPVRIECLTHFLREKHGIYGGLTPIERKRVIDAVRKGRKIPDVLIKVDQRVRAQAREMRINVRRYRKG